MPTTSELAEHLLQTAPEHEDWSIVESPNSAGCYEELLEWAASMNIASWRVDRRMRAHELGLVILWLECEVARRHGGEGSLWPVLSDRNVVPWHDSVHSDLFNNTGAATPLHRELLKRSALHYRVRHTFDEEEGQNWYRLISLQFGFTHDDASNRLALWLSGQLPPVSVQRLLESTDSGAATFQQLWSALRMFRLEKLPKRILESRLSSNSWVLPEWCKDLIEAAKKSSAQPPRADDFDVVELKFITAPKLAFNQDGQPCFTTTLCNLHELKLDCDEYDLKAGDVFLARLIKQPDGNFDAPPIIVLPLEPTVALSLVDPDGNIAIYDEVILWDTSEEVSIYSAKTGRMIPSTEKIRSGSEIYLIASADVSVQPDSAVFYDLVLGYRIHHISSGWVGDLMVFLDDDLIWSNSPLVQKRDQESIGISARFTATLDLRQAQWSDVKPPWHLPFQMYIPAGWTFSRLRWRRADGQLVELDEIPTFIKLAEKDAVRPLIVRVRVYDGNRYKTEVIRVRVPMIAALKWAKQTSPKHHQVGRKILTSEHKKYPWSFCLPDIEGQPRDPRTCSFLEGTTLHTRLKSRPSILPDFDGYGAPLYIVDDPYHPREPAMKVSPCVLDSGVVNRVKWNIEQQAFQIKLVIDTLGPEHELIAFFRYNEGVSCLQKIEVNEMESIDGEWLWKSPENVHLHGIALFYRGCRLGSWFDFSSISRAILDHPPGDPKQVAAMLRIWKAPLLQEDGGHRSRYVEWLKNHWVSALPVWLAAKDENLAGPSGYSWPAPDLSSGWLGVVSDLLLEALPKPTEESASELVETLVPNAKGINAIGAAVWKIADVCPILTALVAKLYLNEFVTTRERESFFKLILGFPELSNDEERAEKIAREQGNRDAFWLHQTVPSLQSIEERGAAAIPHAYRLHTKSKHYRLYALGRWLREIQQS